jgi:zinc-ribbon domain
MALMACPECGNEVSDKAPTCPRCGVPIFRESKVVVYGYTQQFLINPKVQVFWNGSFVGSVKKAERLSIDVDTDGRSRSRALFGRPRFQFKPDG